MDLKTIKLAFGTDNGIEFTNEHFGSAQYYLIYELNLNTKELRKIEERKNTSIEEKHHGDPEKAKSVLEVLKDIQVAVAFVMGPNILKIRKKFIPIISREKNIEKSLNLLLNKIEEIKKNLEKNQEEDKDIIYLK